MLLHDRRAPIRVVPHAALSVNNVAHRRLQGVGKLESSLSAFRQSADVRALLLPLKSGANGISLVEAQHVLLAEPLLEREVEAQAIGRVHRMSQTRPTVVHRFVMSGTIEESILGLRRQSDAAEDEGETSRGHTASSGAGGSPSKGAGGNNPTKVAGGSPTKRQRRAEGSLSWETVQALFSAPAATAPPPANDT